MNLSRRKLALSALPTVAIVGGLTTVALFVGSPRSLTARSPHEAAVQEQATAISLENAFMNVSEGVGPATVSISAKVDAPSTESDADDDEGGEGGFLPFLRAPSPRSGMVGGSGVIVRPEGYIVTNDHVVERAPGGKVTVTLSDGREFEGVVIRDAISDLAIVKIDAKKPLPFVQFADSARLKVGQWAIAIGSPFGQQNTMTTGIVSAMHRKATIQQRLYPDLIQTDAAINPGNSGGPLLNIRGELIGVNVAIDSPSGTSAGIGFAIPANRAKLVVDQLVSKGKVTRGFLGLEPSKLTPEASKILGASKGAFIRSVTPGGPAAKAGVQAGDTVVRVGNEPIEDEYALRDAIAQVPPGNRVEMGVVRFGKTLTLAATPEERKSETVLTSDLPSTLTRPKRKSVPSLGVTVEPLAADDKASFDGKTGLLITQIRRGSPADLAGLSPRLLVLQVNGQSVSDVESFRKATLAAKPGEAVVLTVYIPGKGEDGRTVAIPIVMPN